jgi:hypothetical protein
MVEKAFEQVDTYKLDKSVPKDQYLTEAQIRQLIDESTDKTGLFAEIKHLPLT